MSKIVINIAKEYTKSPGGRFEKEGRFSGEDFRKKFLRPKFDQAEREKRILCVNLDGGYGYATSFLEEAFGGLARETKNPNVLNIEIISDEEPYLVERIVEYMKSGL